MDFLGSSTRPALKLVEAEVAGALAWTWFCGHCAAPAPGGVAPAPNARVCRSCGLGLLLEAREDAAPTPRDAFIVVDSRILVQGMSAQAEVLLQVREDLAVNRPLAELLVSADAENGSGAGFAAAIAESVASGDEPAYAFVRPWNTYGVRVRARIVPCGPPRAALIVFEGPRRGKLHAVSPL
jgi:hypothetical protein